ARRPDPGDPDPVDSLEEVADLTRVGQLGTGPGDRSPSLRRSHHRVVAHADQRPAGSPSPGTALTLPGGDRSDRGSDIRGRCRVFATPPRRVIMAYGQEQGLR